MMQGTLGNLGMAARELPKQAHFGDHASPRAEGAQKLFGV